MYDLAGAGATDSVLRTMPTSLSTSQRDRSTMSRVKEKRRLKSDRSRGLQRHEKEKAVACLCARTNSFKAHMASGQKGLSSEKKCKLSRAAAAHPAGLVDSQLRGTAALQLAWLQATPDATHSRLRTDLVATVNCQPSTLSLAESCDCCACKAKSISAFASAAEFRTAESYTANSFMQDALQCLLSHTSLAFRRTACTI